MPGKPELTGGFAPKNVDEYVEMAVNMFERLHGKKCTDEQRAGFRARGEELFERLKDRLKG